MHALTVRPGQKNSIDLEDVPAPPLSDGAVLVDALALGTLAKADKTWLSRLITRRVPLSRWREAFARRDDDIKVVVDFTA